MSTSGPAVAAAPTGGQSTPGGAGHSGPGYPGAGPARPGLLLGVSCAAQFMVILDLSIVNVALPSVQASLSFSSTGLQWVVDAYAIVFAGTLMLGGRVADHFGLRRTFVAALGLFSLTSLVGGLAVDSGMLVVARAAQGLSGALMAATSLAVITASFPAGQARNRAIGLWGAMNGAGGAVGTLAGGVLTQEAGWRWVLLINPPIGLAAAFVAYRVVTGHGRGTRAGFDVVGAATLTAGQLVLVYGVVQGGQLGWAAPGAVVPMLVGAGLLGLFALVETRARNPLVPLRSLSRPVKVANLIVLLFSASLFSMWYVSSLYLQQVLGLSPLATGLAFLPMALAIFAVASRAGRLVGRLGVRAVLGSGLLLMAVGMLLLARAVPSGSAWAYVVLPGVLTAAGIGLSIVPSTIYATQGAARAQAGMASGLVNTARQAGAGIGLALLVSLATRQTSAEVARQVGVPQALTDGFRLAYLAGAACVVAALVVTIAWARPAAPSGVPSDRRALVALVATLACFIGADLGLARGAGAPIGEYTTASTWSFVTQPGLHPPKVVADAAAPGAHLPGDVLVANFYNLGYGPMYGQSGPLVLGRGLQPVWFHPVPKDVVASNLEEQAYLGHPVLTWWQGVVSSTGATDSGEDVVVNQHYRTVARLRGRDGWVITMHEMILQGHYAWVTASKDVPMDLSRYGGSVDGVLDDSAVQEYDLRTGRLVYTWDALHHVPLSSSHAQPPANGFPWDAYHANSISLAPGGRFLVSMRNTWAAYMVDEHSGSVQWQLGGRGSTIAVPARATFRWQHDVKLTRPDQVTLFNDNCCEITGAGTYLAPSGPSAAEVLRLHLSQHRAGLEAAYRRGPHYSAAYMGNVELLPDGNVFVGWGSQPNFSEFSPGGRLLMDAAFPGPDLSYRALVARWSATPWYPPVGAARSVPGGTAVYASWNGATGVVAWRVLAGSSPQRLGRVAEARSSGFETALRAPSTGFYQVQALGRAGQVLGTSKVFRPAPR